MSDPLLQPYRLKHLTLKNRIFSTAHEPSYTEDGLPKDRYRLYHREKARGGMGMTMIGGSAIVAPDSPAAFGNIRLWDDEVVPWLRAIADEVHGEGCAIMIQITHLGRRTNWNRGDWLPVVAPSLVREPAHRAFPKVMEDWDFARIIAAYADAAERVKAAGLDGLEIEAYGHLFDAFWSPITNRRDDEWGGSLENRLRFSRRVIDAIRERVGDKFLFGLRMVCDEDRAKGIDKEEGLEIARRMVGTGKIDFINVIRGSIDTDNALADVIPNMGARAAPHLDFAAEVKQATGFPTFHAARINDVATARHAIATGRLDLVGMTRAHIADPHITAKIMAGEEQRIRPCVGAGYCIDGIYEIGNAACIHNPATGREAQVPQVLTKSAGPAKSVVVVGAGPAGLEAARVAAERGHRVVLFEAQGQAGGQLRLAASLQRRREIIGIVDWRVAECERLGVTLRFNTLAEAADVLAESPDIVVVATGGIPNTGFLEEGEDLVTTTWDLLSGQVAPAAEVLLYDDNGGHPGMTAAEFLAARGSRFEVVTPERTLAPDVGGTNYPIYFRAIAKAGAKISLLERLTHVRRQGNGLIATFWNEYSRTTSERAAPQVVVEHGTVPVDELYFALKPLSSNLGEVDQAALRRFRPQALVRNPAGRFQLFRVGDAVASRNVHAGIYESLRLLMNL
jgi:2,4-dienoyl-CoA reductase-like NADH-dependent reductase (Old Yellow Enzyme family)